MSMKPTPRQRVKELEQRVKWHRAKAEFCKRKLEVTEQRLRKVHALVGQLAMEPEQVPGFMRDSSLRSVSRAMTYVEWLLEQAGIESDEDDLEQVLEEHANAYKK